MAQHHILRSFVISLAIAIATTSSPACGFTIRHPEHSFDSPPDLETAESTQLEVRNDLKTLNDTKVIDVNKTKEGKTSYVIAINDPKDEDKKSNKNVNETETATQLPLVNKTDSQTRTPGYNNSKIPPTVTKLYAIKTSSNSHTTSILTTTREPEKNQNPVTIDTSWTSVANLSTTPATETQIVNLTKYSNGTLKENFKTLILKKHEAKEIRNSSESKTAVANQKIKQEFSSTEKVDTVNTINNLTNSDYTVNGSISTSVNSYAARKKLSQSILKTNSNRMNQTVSGNTDIETSIIPTMFSSDEATTTESYVTTDVNTETFTVDFNSTTLPPSWKKYTTIDRNRTSTHDPDASGKDMTRAETTQTRINLEKVFTNTPIPSLEKLRNDFINAQELTTITTETNTSNGLDIETSTSTQVMVANIDTVTKKLEIISNRGGYIDNTETTTLKSEEATTSEFPPKVSVNDTELFNSLYETEPSDIDVSENKNATAYESQSQLAEDAIKEELLKEETLNDNEQNAHRYRDEPLIVSKEKSQGEWNITENNASLREVVTEDMLSVKPISQDKKKIAELYAVSPNYKPLKKIDVQPSKQFIRDPDDNSWRNESISSLGIVFKPKNASKSLSQVLKNKTETELGNNTDKDNKGDIPDLRVRLEKIAEVRKSKKNKINRFGDIVYSDYEESVENANASKEDVTSPMSAFIETVHSSTIPSQNSSSTTEFDLTVNAISRENSDSYKNERTTPLTTNKPKKFYNLAEYYDATDEYDADYLNAHKIDLKKFTHPYKATETSTTQPSEMLRTKPMKEYQPERKATVQYFPPTQKSTTQKVNLNDYDTDFNRKVNLYTFKEPSKNVLSVSYGTIPPVQTEKYYQLDRLTGKPLLPQTYKTNNLDKNLYLTNQPRMTEPPGGIVLSDGNFNRASYVIKHYRDFINEAAKDGDDERSSDYLYTESPLRGVTVNELAKMTTARDTGEEEYDYDVKFRKDVLNRFVDNFNQHSERFKVDFPILYNNSVVHTNIPETGKVASSSAFMKRLYAVGNPGTSNFLSHTKPCDPHCDMTVELSPAYELHYYVPDQEEKEEIEPRPTVPYRYRL